MDVLRLATFTDAAPYVSNAYTINGQRGYLHRCSSQGLLLELLCYSSALLKPDGKPEVCCGVVNLVSNITK